VTSPATGPRSHGAAVRPWGVWGAAALGVLVVAGLGLRLWHLGAEGLSDDEIHKWLAANRYLHGDLGGDDVEHPMLMKVLIALVLRLAPAGASAEAITRAPNALLGGALIAAVAQLGRRLSGRAVGIVAAAVVALSPVAVGYGRIAKEDGPLTLFTVLLVLCLAEAHAAAEEGSAAGDGASRRWELLGALALGAMFASKYLVFVFPLPLLAYAWLRAGGARWKVSSRRWLGLAAVAGALFVALDWVVLLPSTWSYLRHYIAGDHLGDRAKSESLMFMGRLYDNLAFHYRGGVPLWFHLAFAAFKLTPPTVLLAALGLGVALGRRAPAHKLLLTWLGVFLLTYAIMSAKYGRYFLPVLPAFALLAAQGAAEVARWLPRAARGWGLGALGLLMAGSEAGATVVRMPHPRLYVNAFGGGDDAVDTAFPHCDYFDAGVREAAADLAHRAEPEAQVASDTPWLTRYYLTTYGRPDVTVDKILPATMCLRDTPCYVIVQTGRRYWHNEAVLDRLAPTTPWAVVDVGGHPAVKVYRTGAR
jgi:4-amino-4-deoxy-L-arabinose transferase-like glycosyltransferase